MIKKLNEDLYAETDELYTDAKVTLTRKVNDLTKANVPSTPAAGGAAHDNGTNESIRENVTIMFPNRTSTGFQLAPEKLPEFNGDYAQWPSFWDLFTRLVHNDEIVAPLAKFNALEQHLRGDAAALIAGIPRRDENYNLAWDIIKNTYENPKLIVNTLLDTLHDVRPMSDENPATLRYILTRYRSVTRQLSAADVDVTTWDPLLTYKLSSLLDSTTRRDWEIDNAKKKTTTLSAMLEFLEDRVTALLNCNRATSRRLQSAVVRPQQQQQHNYRSRSNTPTVGHVAVARKEKPSSNVVCPVCKGQHSVPNCENFLSLNCFPRMQRARSLRLCFGCLATDHAVGQCDVAVCAHCSDNRRHHPLLCFTYCDKLKDNSPMVAFVHGIMDETENDVETMLATALVNVQSASGHPMTARALCDNGGQANLITEELCASSTNSSS